MSKAPLSRVTPNEQRLEGLLKELKEQLLTLPPEQLLCVPYSLESGIHNAYAPPAEHIIQTPGTHHSSATQIIHRSTALRVRAQRAAVGETPNP